MNHISRKRHNHYDEIVTPLMSNIQSKKKNFTLEIKSDPKNILDSSLSSWIKYDLAQEKKEIDLLYGSWQVGLKSCIVSNSLISWSKNKNTHPIVWNEENSAFKPTIAMPTSSFVKLAVKFKDKDKKTITCKFFQNRIYPKDVVISQLNNFLSQMWMHMCFIDNQGTNIVGNVFSLTLFSFYLDKLTNSVHILNLGALQASEDCKKTWNNFQNIFTKFSKTPNVKIETIEIFISNELNSFLGGFQLPDKIITPLSNEKDSRTYDLLHTALDIRCGVIPCDKYVDHSDNTINTPNIFKTPHIGPSLINVYTNLPILQSMSHTKSYKGNIYRYLDQIPVKIINKTFTCSIDYFPKKISHKKLTPNTKIDNLEVLLTDAQTDKPINLDGNFMLTLDFQHFST
jgi:hypothetical protein